MDMIATTFDIAMFLSRVDTAFRESRAHLRTVRPTACALANVGAQLRGLGRSAKDAAGGMTSPGEEPGAPSALAAAAPRWTAAGGAAGPRVACHVSPPSASAAISNSGTSPAK